jgi:hypothetical protein
MHKGRIGVRPSSVTPYRFPHLTVFFPTDH